jgi:hypothetical protein
MKGAEMTRRLLGILMTTALFCSACHGGDVFIFEKEARAEAKMVVDGFLYVDAEDFDDYGGWRMDTQFVHLMGSAFMMATGIGEPVKDATTTINVPKAGDYHVWVRARNWVKDHFPGRFQVAVNGKAFPREFGAARTDQWTWEKGGTVRLDGKTRLALRDLTGFYGRCDAILLTTDGDYIPPEEKEAVCRERARLQGLSLEPTSAGAFDVIVVGGGSAGAPAAVAAARNGAKTALIQNRPTLGGNCSVEAGVGMAGAGGHHPGWREAGIIEEAGWICAKEKQSKYSRAFKQLCDEEENLTLFLNQHVFEAVMDGKKRIKGVKSVSTLTGLISEYRGTLFVDCSGDGWLGYYAGAEYRRGREASSEFGEDLAPEKADDITMSGCIMGDDLRNMTAFRAEETDRPVPFACPLWVNPIETLESPHRSLRGRVPTVGTWWMEHPGTIDDIFKAEEARDELIKISLAFWDYVKNRSDVAEKARNYKLMTIPILDAKRESRRLVGDYILTQSDAQSGRMFPDRIAYSGWNLDIHHPKGIYSGEGGSFDFMIRVPINSVPFRCVYSKNIANLLMAGRCGSFSHVALGTVRVQSTLATIGQAAGTAAAMCVAREIDPRTLGKKHIGELQQELLKDDQTIPGIRNEDPADLARNATVTASSSASGAEDVGVAVLRRIPLNMDRSVMIPVEEGKRIKSVSLYLESKATKVQAVDVRLSGLKEFGAFDTAERVGDYTVEIPAKTRGWIDVPVDAALLKGARFLQIALPEVPGVDWPTMATRSMPGGRSYNDTAVPGEFYAVRTEPPTFPRSDPPGYEAKNVINGWTRLANNAASMWRSDPAQPLPQWVELDFGKATTFNTVQLTFVTDPKGQRPKLPFSPTCVRDYELEALVDGKWVRVIRERDNSQRHRVHSFVKQTATKLRLTVTANHGDKSASLFEIRVYHEAKEMEP